MTLFFKTIAASSVLLAGATQAEVWTTASPDGRVAITLDKASAGLPKYAVTFEGKPVIATSELGLRTDVAGFGAKGFEIADVKVRQVNETYAIVLGKAKSAPDVYTETALTFKETGGERRLGIVVRAYDNGVALRYVVPNQGDFQSFGIYGEKTEFSFPKDYDCWGLNLGKYHNAHEGEFDAVKASMIRDHSLYDSPLVCKTGEGETVFALAESDVEHYPATYYNRKGDNGLGVAVKLPPRLDSDSIKPYVAKISQTGTEFKTPWRVVMIGDSARDLVESNLIATLGAPSKIKDTSWIKGGKSAWDWWNGFNAPVANPGINTETYKAYVDFAKEMGLDYILIDEGWYVGSSTRPKPGSDVTKPIAAVDMPAIIKYAKDRGVRVMIWLQWEQLDWQMDAAFAAYEKWGIAGVKIDFMDRSDQDMVDYFHKVLSKAADHKLLVDLHGAYAPNGLVRTYPNYVTQEGVLGAEYNKWTTRITATHNVTLPFTRMILGPIDYTPGGFAHRTPETFAIHENRPLTQTTRGQAVAMYIVYDSPLVMVSDAPQAYKKPDGHWEDGVEVIQAVPTTWDETRVLLGDIGQYIVTARRKGDRWFIGAMTNEQGRTIEVPLSFLGDGAFKVRLWQDGATVSTLTKSDAEVTKASTMKLVIAPSGGAVAIIDANKNRK
ncbi:glycoside hydrolase family 97 protein [Asticcacaulis sp. BYS171W]|uniref:Glycoside hydrolase family 97 protein n=1 Tax=Asticcacaulis aquaticus TaxID=2984212 RepID=A0ABT5HTY7_9CAUL|nr:glycoside hydrolase family 97 protein [Asticcacaulis aquaticus]MDC7683439.1 glycoside hydrolase family 97 protein [Asticcacaulis aquaticus]